MENTLLSTDSKKNSSSFSCIICLEKRFLSITTPCGHKLCGPCGEKIAETGVALKCPFCRKLWPKVSSDMKIDFHEIGDVTSEEVPQVLCHALQNQQKDIFSKLIEKKVRCDQKFFELGKQRKDVTDFENEQRREVHMAAEHGNLDKLVQFAEGNVDVNQKYIVWSSTPLLAAVEEEHIEVVKFLVEKNADVNAADSRGRTPLWFSVTTGNCVMTKYLCENNANVNISYAGGETPLHQSSRRGFLNICKVFVQHGANLNELDHLGRNASYLAADHGHAEVLKLLLKSGANMPSESSTLQAVLHDLPYYGQLDVIKILAEHGLKLDVAFDCGETPLSRAIAGNHLETVRYLLIDKKVSFETPKHHKPIAHYAAMASFEIVQLLVAQGVDFENMLYNGVTPRDIMHWYGKYHILAFLDGVKERNKPKKRKRVKKKIVASRKKRKVVKRKKGKVVRRKK